MKSTRSLFSWSKIFQNKNCIKFIFIIISSFALVPRVASVFTGVKKLGGFNVNKDFITMSGFSSGGTFAQQMYVSYSSLLAGIAVFSHSYYRCGYGNGVLRDYDAVCTILPLKSPKEYGPRVEYYPVNVLRDIRSYLWDGLIDNPYQHMAHKPLYVFAGEGNYIFTTDMQTRIQHIFKGFINDRNAIKVVVEAANSTLPSIRNDLPDCEGPTNKIQISSCGFSAPLDALQFLYGAKNIKTPVGGIKLQPLLKFDQSEFFHHGGRIDMDKVGYYYVPSGCQKKTECLLHFYFHGCSTGREFVGKYHIVNSGFLEVAEMNGIIMIFPQAIASKENRIGCWDTFGLTGKLYATQKGAQVTVVKNIMDRAVNIKAHKRSPPPVLGIAWPSMENVFKGFI